MKYKLLAVGGLLVASGVFAFTTVKDGKGKDKFKKYEVIHQSNGQTIMGDTIVPVDSPLTPEEFAASLGIDASNIDIIELSNLGLGEAGNAFVFSSDFDHDGLHGDNEWHGKNVKVKMNVITDGDDDEEHFVFDHSGDGDISETVEYKVTVDENGNQTTKKFVNGKEVEVDDSDLDKLNIEHIHKPDGAKEMIVKVETSKSFTKEDGADVNVFHLDTDDKVELDSVSNVWFGKVNELMEGIDLTDTAKLKEMGANVFILDQSVEAESDGDGEVVFVKKRSSIKSGEGDFTMVLVTEGVDPKSNPEEAAASDVQVSIYPNPASDVFTLRVEGKDDVKTSVEVVDINGKVVLKKSLGKISNNHTEELDISKFGSGMYFVKVKQGKQITTEKLMVK